jgi:hypothetical protein
MWRFASFEDFFVSLVYVFCEGLCFFLDFLYGGINLKGKSRGSFLKISDPFLASFWVGYEAEVCFQVLIL